MLKAGDRVKAIKDLADITGSKAPAGSTGFLRYRYRRQDGLEFWSMWLDEPLSRQICVSDDQIHPIKD